MDSLTPPTTPVAETVTPGPDNIAHPDDVAPVVTPVATPVLPAAPVPNPADDYIKKFDLIDEGNRQLVDILGTMKYQPDDQQRLYVVIKYVQELQKHNEDMYDLLIEMNNYFASK